MGLTSVDYAQLSFRLFDHDAVQPENVTLMGRECLDLPCNAMFAEVEWKPVRRIASKEPLPQTAPPLKEFIPLLTQPGGYNRRKTDRPPGPQAIWVGIRRMTDFSLARQAFGPNSELEK